VNESVGEWVDEWVDKWVYKSIIVGSSELEYEHFNEIDISIVVYANVCKWASRGSSDWVSDWMCECIMECLYEVQSVKMSISANLRRYK